MKRTDSRVRRAAFSRMPVALLVAAVLSGCQAGSPDTLLQDARAALQNNDVRTAEIHAKNLLQREPDNAEGRLLLARIHAGNDDFASAEKEWRRALEAGAAPDRALPGLLEALVKINEANRAISDAGRHQLVDPAARAGASYWTGRAQLAVNRPDDAARSFQAAVTADPEHGLAHTSLIAIQASRGDIAGARAAIDQLLARHPALAEGWVLKSDLQLAAMDAAGARQSLVTAVDSAPRQVDARLKLVSLLLQDQQYPEAEQQLADLQKLAPGSPLALHLRSLSDFRQKRIAAADEANQQVLRVAPDFMPAVALAGNIALLQKAPAQAEMHARRVIAAAPNSPEALRLLALVHLQKNEPDRALRVVKPALDRGLQDPTLMAIAGEAALRINDVKAATGYFDQAARLDPNDPAKRTGLALARLATGNASAGFADLEAAVELDEGSTQSDYALIMARLREKQYDQALAAIDRLEKKQPGTALPYNLRGVVLQAKGDQPAARRNFERAAEVDPGFYAAAANLAALDMRDKRPADARARFERLLAKDPNNVQALLAMASINRQTDGPADETLRLLQRARAADPSAIAPVMAMADQLMRNGQPRDAVPILQQALQQHPDHPQLLDMLGGTLLRVNERQQALDAYTRLARVSPKLAAVHLRIGEIKAAMGDFAGAMDGFRQAEQLDPTAIEPKFAVAMHLLRSNDPEGARRIATALQKDHPKHPAGLTLEGDVLASQQKWPEAAAVYRRAAAILRNDALVIKQHNALNRAGRSADADAVLNEGLKATPGSAALRMYAGEQQLARKQWKAAVDIYDPLIAENPRNAVALNNLAWSLYQLKDSRALQIAERAYAAAPSAPAIADTYGRVLVEFGDKTRGLQLIRQAVSAAPKAPGLRLSYAEALATTGDREGARRELDALIREFAGSPEAKTARERMDKL